MFSEYAIKPSILCGAKTIIRCILVVMEPNIEQNNVNLDSLLCYNYIVLINALFTVKSTMSIVRFPDEI